MKDILTDDTKQVLSEESLGKIEEAFTQKINLAVEAALTEQDNLYAEKLKELMEAIDKDHSDKLKKIVKAVDSNNTQKLKKVVEKYESDISAGAKEFKDTLVESISDYLEEFIDEAIPAGSINEATQNKTAMQVLGNLRSVLAIDSALMQESVKGAVVDGKTQIDELTKKLSKVEKENAVIKESYLKTKASLVLETKIASLPEKKKEYIKRVLGDKTPKFIEENFDYTLRLFDKKEKERLETLKEEAFEGRSVKADVPIIKESTAPQKEAPNPYLAELNRMK